MTSEIPLTQGKVAIVDDEDVERVLASGKWGASRRADTWYACRDGPRPRRLKVYMHRVVLGLGPDDPDVDHVDGDGLNNRRSNLRLATASQNLGNQRARAHSSRFKGVYRNKQGRWQTQISVEGVKRHLGTFDTEEEAGSVYDAAARSLFGEFARPSLVATHEFERKWS